MVPSVGFLILGVSFVSGFTGLPASTPASTPQSVPPPPGPNSSPSPSPALVPPPSVNPNASKKDPNCIAKDLSQATWQALKLDEYLNNYPGGQIMNLAVSFVFEILSSNDVTVSKPFQLLDPHPRRVLNSLTIHFVCLLFGMRSTPFSSTSGGKK